MTSEFIAHELLDSFQAVGCFLKRAKTVEEAKEAQRLPESWELGSRNRPEGFASTPRGVTTGHHSVFGTAAKKLAVETDSTFARLLDSIHLPFPTDVVLSMIREARGWMPPSSLSKHPPNVTLS